MKTLIFISSMLVGCSSCLKVKSDTPVIAAADTTTLIKVSYKERAKQVYDNIYHAYHASGNLFRENYPAQGGDPANAYFWSHTSLFGAAMLLQSLGYTDASFQQCSDGMNEYWDRSRTPAGFQSAIVSRGQSDRFYDDNATAGLDLMRAYQVTSKQEYLDKADSCLLFDMSGESTDQGGGLFWNESYKTNNIDHPWCIKATNATAFAATLALKLYQVKHNAAYLDAAKRWYSWIKTKMQDPSDKMFWNDVALKNSVINQTKWTYNVGEMITNACLLYTITNDNTYLTEARDWAQRSYNYFTRTVRDQGRFFPANDPWFTMILLRGYIDLYTIDHNAEYVNTVAKNVDYAWLHSRTTDGFFYEDWAGDYKGRYYWILNQECMVEIYALLSKFKNEQ